MANALRGLGIGKGDVVGIYMGMVPELPVAMLACARIGAPHVVVFGGFSAESLGERLESTGAKALITQDEAWRKGAGVALKTTADEAARLAPSIESMVVLRRTGADVPMQAGRDHWWHELVPGQADTCEPELVDAEHMLYALHTSGTTAKPKAAVHTSGGYLTFVALTHKWIFDIHDDDVWWCAADIGWVTGHSYIVYGPLANGATGVLYEGDPMFPGPERHWEIIAKHRVTQYYTAPTLIRAFIKSGPEIPARHDLSSLRLLGTVGEPINPEAWVWYWKFIGGERCPIVDTWWQTETGGILITPLPALVTQKPGSATRPFPGIAASVVDDHGNPVEKGKGGYLVITRPWPGMFRTLYRDDERYVSNYFSRFDVRTYFPGDGARQDDDGDFWLLGRVDDVMNVSGHRLSTIELESTLVEHPAVAEAAATAAPDSFTGQTPLCFVLLRAGYEPSDELAAELREWIGQKIGKIARPEGRHHRRRPAQDPVGQDHAAPAQGHRRGPRPGRHDDAPRPCRGRRPEAPRRRDPRHKPLTRILLIRHAEPVRPTGASEENDRPLTAAGAAAARELALSLADEPIDSRLRLTRYAESTAPARRLPRTTSTTYAAGTASRAARHRRRAVGTQLPELAERHPGATIAAVSHGNLIALVLNAHDPAIGFGLWDAMPMPALYEIEVDPRSRETAVPGTGVSQASGGVQHWRQAPVFHGATA